MTHNTDTITTETYAAIGKFIIDVLTACDQAAPHKAIRVRRVLDQARRDEIIRRRREGQTYETICSEMHVSSKTIAKIAKELRQQSQAE